MFDLHFYRLFRLFSFANTLYHSSPRLILLPQKHQNTSQFPLRPRWTQLSVASHHSRTPLHPVITDHHLTVTLLSCNFFTCVCNFCKILQSFFWATIRSNSTISAISRGAVHRSEPQTASSALPWPSSRHIFSSWQFSKSTNNDRAIYTMQSNQ